MKKTTLTGVMALLCPLRPKAKGFKPKAVNLNFKRLPASIACTLLLCFCLCTGAQQPVIKPLRIGERLPDVQLTHIINYKAKSATLSDFQNNYSRMLLLDFWNTRCMPCIRAFAKLDSLQQQYGEHLQILLVTYEDSATVQNLLSRWEAANKKKLSVPIITKDTVLKKYIRKRYNPHYAWVAPDGVLLAQTSASFVTHEILEAYMKIMLQGVEKRNSETRGIKIKTKN